MKFNLGLILAKVETVYGTDSVPTNTANVITAENVDIQPLEMETDDYAPVSTSFGQGEKIVGSTWASLSFDVLLNGGGAPLGTAPNYAPLMRACGMAQTVNASTSVVYNPISTGEESVSIYYFLDGIRQRLLGARGSWELKFDARKAPRISFKFIGLNQPMTDVALPVPTLPTTPRPVAMNSNNTTLTIDGYAVRVSSFSISQGGDVQYRDLTNSRDVQIVDRMMSGKCTIELPLVAQKDFLGASGLCTLASAVAFSLMHGTVLGNRVAQAAPKIQLLKPKTKAENGIVMLECDMHFARNTVGNDEFSMTLT
jgi:hypothetical protein